MCACELQLFRLANEWQIRRIIVWCHWRWYKVLRCALWCLRKLLRKLKVPYRLRWIEDTRREYFRRHCVFTHRVLDDFNLRFEVFILGLPGNIDKH